MSLGMGIGLGIIPYIVTHGDVPPPYLNYPYAAVITSNISG